MSEFTRKRPIERIIGPGFDEDDRALAEKMFQSRFENQNFSDLNGKEEEKTEDELKIINWLNGESNRLLVNNGAVPLQIPSPNVHIISEEVWGPLYGDKASSEAAYSWRGQAIFLPRKKSRAFMAKLLYHEMLHMKSHQAVQHLGGSNFGPYRSGLVSFDRSGSLNNFLRLNEAVIEEASADFFWHEISGHPLFRSEIERTQAIKDVLRKEIIAVSAISEEERTRQLEELEDVCWADLEDGDKLATESVTYSRERKVLKRLIKSLYERNQARYSDSRDIEKMWIRAVLKGHLVELGNLIDKTYGAGTFRKLGVMSSEKHTVDDLEQFVATLL